MNEKKQILYDSDQAAVYEEKKIKGWWSVKSNNRGVSVFWDNDEHMARWDGCTHMLCKECGEHVHSKSYTCCKVCRAKHQTERYKTLPKKTWDGKSPICLYKNDEYFWDEDDVMDYCEENDCTPEDLQLCHCEPVSPPEFNIIDFLEDFICEETENGDLPQRVLDATAELNEALNDANPISWVGSDTAVLWNEVIKWVK